MVGPARIQWLAAFAERCERGLSRHGRYIILIAELTPTDVLHMGYPVSLAVSLEKLEHLALTCLSCF